MKQFHSERNSEMSKKDNQKSDKAKEFNESIEKNDEDSVVDERACESDDIESNDIEKLKTERDENNDQLLRMQAELQNMRRRSERDVENAHKFALEKFSNELVPVLDDVERAFAATDASDESQMALREGLELTIKNFIGVFKKFNIECVDPKGEPFDAELHQAVSMQVNEDVEPGTVLDVFQKGYTLNHRLLRPAMVVVSKS